MTYLPIFSLFHENGAHSQNIVSINQPIANSKSNNISFEVTHFNYEHFEIIVVDFFNNMLLVGDKKIVEITIS